MDKFVLSFCDILRKNSINYVLVSGYVVIVFGRSRNTEDVDILFEDCGQEKFEKLFADLEKAGFACIQAKDAKSAYSVYLTEDLAIRFYTGDSPIPNIEFKFAKTALEKDTLDGKTSLMLNSKELFISPLEIQIAYKLYIGNEKDINDARYLYRLFKDNLNIAKLSACARDLNVKTSVLYDLVGK
ncbi:hypothetical protein COV61_00045 [Candidatus Micrarchaeota archaeon CG11_big_fil_rev_8_21_14_0_20_47_5]|nr:MAG: hypothetical protein COV61_00045 [Candidatus Micrarchaeota archaeon CG11_big_fil_rev_8_21_14_0_20_47_5]